MPQPIPAGYHTVTPSFTFKDSRKAIDFYQKAFDAKILGEIMPGVGGKGTMHATLQIGNSIIMMGDEIAGGKCVSAETSGQSPISLYIYVQDADAAFKKAIAAGAKEFMPVMDMFWGDRAGSLMDPFGYSWMIATHKQDLTTDQIKKGAEAFFAAIGQKK